MGKKYKALSLKPRMTNVPMVNLTKKSTNIPRLFQPDCMIPKLLLLLT